MLKYTICFIKQGDKLLMLNREYPTWMGMWNGVGGKIEKGEAPLPSIKREIYEETGLTIDHVIQKGIVTWSVDGVKTGGMYAFIAELPETVVYKTPAKTDEGILDWKEIDWLLNPDNDGVVPNIPFFLPKMLLEDKEYEHLCIFENDDLVDCKTITLQKKELVR